MSLIRYQASVILILAVGLLTLPVPASSQETDSAAATRALVEFEEACQDATQLWPVELCGPIVVVDRRTRVAVANRPDPDGQFAPRDGAFVGGWPAEKPVANTGFDWDGTWWAMTMLPLSEDRFSRLRLLAHESFHRIQPALGHEMSDTVVAHLDEEQGRLWLRLELRALAQALVKQGDEARQAALDALHFRRVRHDMYPGSGASEQRLEAHEGLAEYTGVRFALDVTDAGPEQVKQLMEAFERRPTFVRSLGYGTGPALGLLLDRYEPGWRDTFLQAPALAHRLAIALDAPQADPDAPSRMDVAAERAAAYGVDAVRVEEQERAQHRAAALDAYRKALVEGPTLTIDLPDRLLLFNPNTVLPMKGEGSVYPGATLMGAWGRLTIQEGAALGNPDRSRARVAAPTNVPTGAAGTIDGPGWTLELEPDWQLVPGDRPGDYRLQSTADN